MNVFVPTFRQYRTVRVWQNSCCLFSRTYFISEIYSPLKAKDKIEKNLKFY